MSYPAMCSHTSSVLAAAEGWGSIVTNPAINQLVGAALPTGLTPGSRCSSWALDILLLPLREGSTFCSLLNSHLILNSHLLHAAITFVAHLIDSQSGTGLALCNNSCKNGFENSLGLICYTPAEKPFLWPQHYSKATVADSDGRNRLSPAWLLRPGIEVLRKVRAA